MIGRCEMQCDGIRAVVLATAPNDKIQREGQVITPILLEAPDYHHKSREKIYIFSQKKFHYRKKRIPGAVVYPKHLSRLILKTNF